MEYLSVNGLSTSVSRIGLGTWAIGGLMWGGTHRDSAIATIRAALDFGITLIDTAPIYGHGLSEELIGHALRDHPRESVVIATKCGLRWDGVTVWRDLSPTRIASEVHDSLRRLKTDYIDILQIHWPQDSSSTIEIGSQLLKLIESGKVLVVGVCNYSASQTATLRAIVPIQTIQPPYNVFERQAEEAILPYAHTAGLQVFAHSALCRGLLCGKNTTLSTFSANDVRSFDPKFTAPRFAEYLAAVNQLDVLAQNRYGKSVLNLAVRWILDRGNYVALCGARSPEQLAHVPINFGWTIDADTRLEIDEIVKNLIHHPIAPDFMKPRQDREGRLPR